MGPCSRTSSGFPSVGSTPPVVIVEMRQQHLLHVLTSCTFVGHDGCAEKNHGCAKAAEL